jgi:hypothetical protein
MKTVTYPVRIDQAVYDTLVQEAKRRQKSLADLFRDLISYGLPALPPVPDYEAAAKAWISLGPPPEVLYDKLPKEW